MIFRYKNKYNAKRTSDGFPSQLEKAVYEILLMQQRAGVIQDIKRQDCVKLSLAQISCKIDFSYIDCHDKKKYYVEAKGVKTERWRIIEKLWKYYGPATLIIYGGSYKKPQVYETIIPI